MLSDGMKDKRKDKLKIRDAGDGRMEVSKLSDHQINSSEEAFKLMVTLTLTSSNINILVHILVHIHIQTPIHTSKYAPIYTHAYRI